MPFWCDTMNVLGDITVTLAPDANLVGTGSLIADPASTAVYYNMQGMATDCPADGEIIIEKKAGKTIKRVYRNR